MRIWVVSHWNVDGTSVNKKEYFLHQATAEQVGIQQDGHCKPMLGSIEVDERLPEQHKTELQMKAEALAKAKEVLSLDVLKRLGLL